MFNQDGIDTKPRHFVIPVYNSASEEPPYTRVMGNPIPDTGWSRERASECDPWYPGNNGCPTPTTHHTPSYQTSQTTTSEATPVQRSTPKQKTYRGS